MTFTNEDGSSCGAEVSGELLEISSPSTTAPPFIKSGTVDADSFEGTPLLYEVVFDSPFLDDTYAVVLSGVDARLFTYQSKTADGFTINANSDSALTGEVSWIAIVRGETL